MPGTLAEFVSLAIGGLPIDFPQGIRWADGTEVTDIDALDVRLLRDYLLDQLVKKATRDRQRRAQRKALRVLRRYLTPIQRSMLRWRGAFLARSPNGSMYRIDARRGRVERVSNHGMRWYVLIRYCIHEPDDTEESMPPADLALTFLFWIQSDEQTFLKIANATNMRDLLWNGNWVRRVREARLQRESLL